MFIPKLHHTVTNCSAVWTSVFYDRYTSGISVESRELQVYGEESDDPRQPWTIIICAWTSSFTQDYSLNTIFCGPITQNPLFVVVSAVIKDLRCGSHKYTQTHVYESGVCARTCAFVHLYGCMCFAKGREREGEVTGKQLATASHPPPTQAPWMHRRPHLSRNSWSCHHSDAAPSACSHLEGGEKRVGEERGRAKFGDSKWINVKRIFTYKNIWNGALQGNKMTRVIQI